jgi:tetratricopeptide (TPR) repeat protein
MDNVLEEEIFVELPENTGKFFSYSLSNDLAEIGRAIHARTSVKFDLETAVWNLNHKLSVSVKDLMNRHNVEYSMTTWTEGSHKRIVINRRSGDKWFYCVPQTKEAIEAKAHYDKGSAYFPNDIDKAIAEFSEVINLDPDFIHAYGIRAVAYALKGQFDEESKDIIEMARLDPNMASHYYEFRDTVLNIKNRHLSGNKGQE